jgi:hypothetical protein
MLGAMARIATARPATSLSTTRFSEFCIVFLNFDRDELDGKVLCLAQRTN